MSTIPTKQLAALASHGKPVWIEEVKVQSPKEDELLVKITSAAINPIDWKLKDVAAYQGFVKSWPLVLGSDGSGVVAAVGKNVNNFKTGDRVFFQGIVGDSEHSTFQQYSLISSSLAARAPSNISDDEASTIPLGFITPAVALYTPAGAGISVPALKDGDQAGKGQSIVILGGSSSVGQYAIQLARLSGFSRIVTSASSSHKDLLKKIGGENTVVLERQSSKVWDYVEALSGLPLRTVFDSISDESTQTLSVQVLKEFWSKQSNKAEYPLKVNITGRPSDAAKTLAEESNLSITLAGVFGSGHLPQNKEVAEALWGSMEKWVESGKIVPNKTQVIKGGLKGLEEALQLHKAGVSGVKIVINPDQTQ